MARELRQAGYEKARALVGGWTVWQIAEMPVEKKLSAVSDQPSA